MSPVWSPSSGWVVRHAVDDPPGRSFTCRLVVPTYGPQRLTVTTRPRPDAVEAQVRDGAGTVTSTAALTAAAP